MAYLTFDKLRDLIERRVAELGLGRPEVLLLARFYFSLELRVRYKQAQPGLSRQILCIFIH